MATDTPSTPQAGVPTPLWEGDAPQLHDVEPPFSPYIIPFPSGRTDPHGAVVVLPGGGYAGRAEHEADPIAQMFNEHGLSAFVCHYRVAPYRHPCPWLDASRAVRWVRAHAELWSIDPAHVGILGFSAGGHLASTVATHFDDGDLTSADPVARCGSRPDAAILCYAVIKSGPDGHPGSFYNLLGPNPPEDLLLALSNDQRVTSRTPPTFLWSTDDDQAVPVGNSLAFAEACRANEVPFALHVFPRGDHGLGLAPDHPLARAWPDLCCDWLKYNGF